MRSWTFALALVWPAVAAAEVADKAPMTWDVERVIPAVVAAIACGALASLARERRLAWAWPLAFAMVWMVLCGAEVEVDPEIRPLIHAGLEGTEPGRYRQWLFGEMLAPIVVVGLAWVLPLRRPAYARSSDLDDGSPRSWLASRDRVG